MNKSILIRKLSDELHKEAKHAAINAGISLNAWLIEAIKLALQTRKESDSHENMAN
jgi:predicted HicB family RNase H-like nuclease